MPESSRYRPVGLLGNQRFDRPRSGQLKIAQRFSAGFLRPIPFPFDPGREWQLQPQALRPGRRGFRVKATVNGCALDSEIVPRQKRWFLLVDADTAQSAGVSVADTVRVTVEPS